MKRVIIESPYAGDIEANVEYARRCVRDSVLRGEAPIASHLLFTQPGILRDDKPVERELGIAAGLAWLSVADFSIFYVDRGWSRGMYNALVRLCNTGNSILPFHLRFFEELRLPILSNFFRLGIVESEDTARAIAILNLMKLNNEKCK